MLKVQLWEAIMLIVISRVMVLSHAKYCNINNIIVCDYTNIVFRNISIIVGYFLGKVILKYYKL